MRCMWLCVNSIVSVEIHLIFFTCTKKISNREPWQMWICARKLYLTTAQCHFFPLVSYRYKTKQKSSLISECSRQWNAYSVCTFPYLHELHLSLFISVDSYFCSNFSFALTWNNAHTIFDAWCMFKRISYFRSEKNPPDCKQLSLRIYQINQKRNKSKRSKQD